MADVVFLLVAAAFFGLCVAYVRGLDRLIRAAEDAPGDDRVLAGPEAVDGVAR